MPRRNHYGRTQTRPYTDEYYKLPARVFNALLTAPLADYVINADFLGAEHKKLTLTQLENNTRVMIFTINKIPHQIALKLNNSSASNKLYITCPYCQKNRQSLYVAKYTYACRECLGLHYASQSERPQARLMRRIRKLRKDLWGYDWPEVNNMFKQVLYWPKPKQMRWKTFEEKRNKIIELEKRYWPMAIIQMENNFSNYSINYNET